MFGQTHILTYNLLFAVTAYLLLMFSLLPQESSSLAPLPWPDLLFCFIAAWRLRRPELVSPAVIVVAVLVAELLFLQPLGLWAALVLLAAEFFRSIVDRIKFLPFTYEWVVMASAYSAMILIYQLILAMSLVPVPDTRTVLLNLLATILAYPLIVATTNLVFRIRKSSSIKTGLMEGSR